MALQSKGNKNSATEDEVGLLHALVTKIFKKKLEHWIQLIEAGGDADLIVDMKQLNNVIKFIGDNGIVCQDAAASTTTELGADIANIKAAQAKRLNLVSFEEDYEGANIASS